MYSDLTQQTMTVNDECRNDSCTTAGSAADLKADAGRGARLLCQLSQGEYCVSELEALVGLGQPSLSQQLGVLRQEGLVETRRAGKQIYYKIISDDAMAVLQVLYQRFCPDAEDVSA